MYHLLDFLRNQFSKWKSAKSVQQSHLGPYKLAPTIFKLQLNIRRPKLAVVKACQNKASAVKPKATRMVCLLYCEPKIPYETNSCTLQGHNKAHMVYNCWAQLNHQNAKIIQNLEFKTFRTASTAPCYVGIYTSRLFTNTICYRRRMAHVAYTMSSHCPSVLLYTGPRDQLDLKQQ